MTPERIAEVRERHRPKPNRDYTDCGECYEEHPCETIQALDALAAASEREQAYRAAIERACRFFGVLAHDADRCYQRQRYAESFDDGIPAHWLLQMAASARSASDQTSAVLAAGGPADGRGDG